MSQQNGWSPETKIALAAIGALLYVVCPLDGDFLPVIGWLDDLGVMGVAVAYVMGVWQEMSQQAKAVEKAPTGDMIVDAEVVEPSNVIDAEFTVSPMRQVRK